MFSMKTKEFLKSLICKGNAWPDAVGEFESSDLVEVAVDVKNLEGRILKEILNNDEELILKLMG